MSNNESIEHERQTAFMSFSKVYLVMKNLLMMSMAGRVLVPASLCTWPLVAASQ